MSPWSSLKPHGSMSSSLASSTPLNHAADGLQQGPGLHIVGRIARNAKGASSFRQQFFVSAGFSRAMGCAEAAAWNGFVFGVRRVLSEPWYVSTSRVRTEPEA